MLHDEVLIMKPVPGAALPAKMKAVPGRHELFPAAAGKSGFRKGKIPSGFLDILFLLLSVSALFLLYYYLQPHINYDKCPLCDGYRYRAMYEYLNGSRPFSIDFPYYSRMLVPLLAWLFPVNDPVTSFTAINYIFTLLSLVTIYYTWSYLNIPRFLMITGFFWICFHWSGMIRFNIYDPITIDVPVYFFQALFLLIVFYKKTAWLLLLGPVATLQKESFIPLLAVYFLYCIIARYFLYEYRNILYPALALILAVLSKAAYTWYLPSTEPELNAFRVMLYHAREIYTSPMLLLRIIICFITAYGAFMIGFVQNIKLPAIFFDPRQRVLFVCSLLYIFFDLFAGRDITRVSLLGFPFIMTLILYHLKDQSYWFWLQCLLLSLPFMQLFRMIPVQTAEPVRFENFMPDYAPWEVLKLPGVYIICCILIFVIQKQYFSKKNVRTIIDKLRKS